MDAEMFAKYDYVASSSEEVKELELGRSQSMPEPEGYSFYGEEFEQSTYSINKMSTQPYLQESMVFKTGRRSAKL
jgi:hypothetical protein